VGYDLGTRLAWCENPFKIVSVRFIASLPVGVEVLEAVLECISLSQVKFHCCHGLDILCIVEIVNVTFSSVVQTEKKVA
jgi:hypothetical protein